MLRWIPAGFEGLASKRLLWLFLTAAIKRIMIIKLKLDLPTYHMGNLSDKKNNLKILERFIYLMIEPYFYDI